MKRVDHLVAAGRSKLNSARRDVAGMHFASRWRSLSLKSASDSRSAGASSWDRVVPDRHDVASFQHALGQSLDRALDDPKAARVEDAMLLADFTDFLDCGLDSAATEDAGSELKADPDFRERLRGRLWRIFVQTRQGDGGAQH